MNMPFRSFVKRLLIGAYVRRIIPLRAMMALVATLKLKDA